MQAKSKKGNEAVKKTGSDVVIVGGGASGLAAAVRLGMSSPDISVALIEKNSEPGRKIRATGSGRCNISNVAAEGYDEIIAFFGLIGLATRVCGSGLVYPYSESAADVADLLTERAEELGVNMITDAEVTEIRREESSGRFVTEYTVRGDDRRTAGSRSCRQQSKRICSEYVILACGGKAGPMFGTTGDGYRLARAMGHSIVTPVPVLTSAECREWDRESRPDAVNLAGTRTRGKVTLLGRNGAVLYEETGEIQFTRYGLSGICVFNMSRHMRYDRSSGGSLDDFIIETDLYPDGDIRDFIRSRRENALAGESAGCVLRTVLKSNIAAYVIARSGISANTAVSGLSDGEIEALASAVHSLTFRPSAIRGWKEAQATSGGISLKEIDQKTCGSLLVPGLYICGELADRDFPCGGFNLSNAWLTGMQAADDIAAVSGPDK